VLVTKSIGIRGQSKPARKDVRLPEEKTRKKKPSKMQKCTKLNKLILVTGRFARNTAWVWCLLNTATPTGDE
jgi:hypothetical protein